MSTASKPTAEQVRAAIPDDMLRVLDLLKETFGAKLVFVATETLTMGKEIGE